MTTRISWLRPLALLLVIVGCLAVPIAPAESPTWPRNTMREVFVSMAYLLPRALDPERFASPEEHAGIAKQLDALAKSAGRLEHHSWQRASSLGFLNRSLARDINEAQARFRAGRIEEARFFVIGSLQNCVACHSRSPSQHRFAVAEQLTDSIELASLSKQERALLYVTTRRFVDAAQTWEQVLADPKVAPVELEMNRVFLDYLAITIRGLGDYRRSREALLAFSKRGDLFERLRKEVQDWIESLGWLEAHPNKEIDLARARKLMERSDALNQWPGDRRGLVYDLAASSILHQLADGAGPELDAAQRAEMSEAYYRLGKIESLGLAGNWLDMAPDHLEAAMRLDPKGQYAQPAFSLLQEVLTEGFAGAEESDLPTDVWLRLVTLRQLLESS